MSELPISQLNVRFITHLLIDRYYEILTKAASLKSALYFTLPSSLSRSFALVIADGGLHFSSL